MTLRDFESLANKYIELKEENKQLKDNWNKLREGLKFCYEFDYGVLSKDYLECVDDTLDKMQELEKGSDSNDFEYDDRSIEQLQQENKKLKEIYKELFNAYQKLKKENEEVTSLNLHQVDKIQQLKEQLLVAQTNEETFRLEMKDITQTLGLDEDTIFDDVKAYVRSLKEKDKKETQQKEFIKYLEDERKRFLSSFNTDGIPIIEVELLDVVLENYKKIMGLKKWKKK